MKEAGGYSSFRRSGGAKGQIVAQQQRDSMPTLNLIPKGLPAGRQEVCPLY